MNEHNPLLIDYELPPFEQFRVEHILPAIKKHINRGRTLIETLTDDSSEPTYESLIAPLEEQERLLDNSWALVQHLKSVKDSEELRPVYREAREMLTEYSTWVGQHRALYEAYKTISEQPVFPELPEARRRSVERSLLGFRLNGVHLPEEKRDELAAIRRELSRLGQQFSENILDATKAWTKMITDENELAGLPETAISTLADNARRKGLEGWLITLNAPSVMPVLTFSENRALREELVRAYQTRASDQGPNAGEFDNGPVMAAITAGRQEMSSILGYENYASLALEYRIAGSTGEVLDFLYDLAGKTLEGSRKEHRELEAFAEKELGLQKIEPWDIGYAVEKMRQARYSFSQEEVRPYFPAPKVVEGLLDIVNRLYGIDLIEVKDFETYHPDVKLFEVRDEEALIGRMYMDLYTRDEKKSGAWMGTCRGRGLTPRGIQLPCAYLVCNFTPPGDDAPSLLKHGEVSTLFHEFGHALHLILTEVDVLDLSGTSGVERDGVELPSKLFESWCWEKEGIDPISSHIETGEPLPETLLTKMVAARNFRSASGLLGSVRFSLFDYRLHCLTDPPGPEDILALMEEIRDKFMAAPVIPENRFPHRFSHIFAGGYAAGYYGYKWAEVLAADAFERFREEGLFNRDTAEAYRKEILSRGGTRSMADLFRSFRGRDPQPEPMLRHHGLID